MDTTQTGKRNSREIAAAGAAIKKKWQGDASDEHESPEHSDEGDEQGDESDRERENENKSEVAEEARSNYLPIPILSDSDSNGGSGDLKNSDGVKTDRGVAETCNSESVSDHNSGGVGDFVEGANLIMRLKAWEIKELRMRIWRMTSYVKQLKKVNYGIVVGLKAARSELRRLRKAEGEVQRNKSTAVVKKNLRMVKDLVTEKEIVCVSARLAPTVDSSGTMSTRLESEESSVADSKNVLAERADGAGLTAVEGPQRVVLFDQLSKRQTRAAVSRTAREVARKKHVNSRRRKKKGQSTRPSEPLSRCDRLEPLMRARASGRKN